MKDNKVTLLKETKGGVFTPFFIFQNKDYYQLSLTYLAYSVSLVIIFKINDHL